MNPFLRLFLTLSLIFFTACTTLTGPEKCSLLGQVQQGTQIGTQTHVSSIGTSVYSYNTPSYNTICALPKTEEERKAVQELRPTAESKKKQRNKEYMIYYGSMFGLLIITTIIALDRPEPYYDYGRFD